ncbi:Hypothetical predicted protein, partial [Mytilus galloprovincialis]
CKCSTTFQCPPSTKCAPGEIVTVCKTNPCDVSSCRRYPKAKCCPSYCGRCKALWFVD